MVATPQQHLANTQVAARARHMTRDEWLWRADDLAWKEHTIGALRYRATQADGSHIYTAPSRSNPQHPHIMVISMQHEIVTCDCSAAAYGLPCAHVGAALYLMRQIISACVNRNMVGQRQYEDWAATLNSAS